MKKVLILGVLVVLAGSSAYAQTQNFLWSPQAPSAGIGETYNVHDIWNVPRPPRPLPVPTFDLDEGGKDPVDSPKFQSVPGPMTFIGAEKGAGMDGNIGSAIVLPRGGAFMTPRREADMQIRKLIGKLD